MERVWRVGWAALVLAFAVGAVGRAETLTYRLAPRPDKGVLEVELRWATAGRDVSRVCVSEKWGTVRDVPALIRDLQVEGAQSVSRDGACWVVRHRAGAELRFAYTVDPGRRAFDWESTHHPITTAGFFHGVGNAFLLAPGVGGAMPDEYEVLLRWELPRGWRAVCSWAPGEHVGARMSARDLRHSVYLAGKLLVRTRELPEADELTVAIPSALGFDMDALFVLSAEIVAGQCEFMRERLFPPFVVTAIPVGEAVSVGEARLTGVGLYHSFALCAAPRTELKDGFEHLFAHELFHYWNGRLLPAREPAERVYWFVEGFTDYYALRILYESGRWDAATYAKWINRHLKEYHDNPARNARNEVIEREFWSARDTVGEVAYQRGLLLGLRWRKLAEQRGAPGGLDAWFKELVAEGRGAGLEVDNGVLRAAGVRAMGEWFGEEFDRYVMRAETVEVPVDALAPALVGRVKAVYAFDAGFAVAESLKERTVLGLKAGGPAARAGLRAGDKLVGWTVHGDPDKQMVLQVERGGDVKEIKYLPRGKGEEVMQFGAD